MASSENRSFQILRTQEEEQQLFRQRIADIRGLKPDSVSDDELMALSSLRVMLQFGIPIPKLIGQTHDRLVNKYAGIQLSN